MKESIWKVALETKKNNKKGAIIHKNMEQKQQQQTQQKVYRNTERNIIEKKKKETDSVWLSIYHKPKCHESWAGNGPVNPVSVTLCVGLYVC